MTAAAAIFRRTTSLPRFLSPPLRAAAIPRCRGLALWSSTKDPALESALSRNRRWIVNNQIKQQLLRSPDHTAAVSCLQKKFKTLDLQGRALNWLQKYPSCFQILLGDGDGQMFTFSKRMAALVEEEQRVLTAQHTAITSRFTKLLMLSRRRRISLPKLNLIKRSIGLPDDYLISIVAANPDIFRIVSHTCRRSSMEIELLNWDSDLAISAIEAYGHQPPQFRCSLPSTWIKTIEKFEIFNFETPYISPYKDDWSVENEKAVVGMVHELLSLTLWKKASVIKFEHLKREFGLPEKLNLLLLKHPCIFYVSNKYKIYTVVLREAYNGSELIDKDPIVMVKDKFGELMQEGLHEHNRRRREVNMEKKRKKGEIFLSKKREEDDEGETLGLDSVEKREERKRFYKVLFDEKP